MKHKVSSFFVLKVGEFMEIANVIILASSVLVSIGTIFGVIFSVYRWYLNQNQKNEQQDKEIEETKKENKLICYGLCAALDGLTQLGCNHTVPKAKSDLEKYLNEKAHE